jgi:hypothetical protein
VQKAFCATGGFFGSWGICFKGINSQKHFNRFWLQVAEHEMREQARSLGRRCQGKPNASAFSFALFLWHSLGDCE